MWVNVCRGAAFRRVCLELAEFNTPVCKVFQQEQPQDLWKQRTPDKRSPYQKKRALCNFVQVLRQTHCNSISLGLGNCFSRSPYPVERLGPVRVDTSVLLSLCLLHPLLHAKLTLRFHPLYEESLQLTDSYQQPLSKPSGPGTTDYSCWTYFGLPIMLQTDHNPQTSACPVRQTS